MQKIILLLAISAFISFQVSAQRRVKRQGVTPVNVGNNNTSATKFTYNYKLEQFKGRWQEINRTYKNKQPAPITDTVFIYFKEENKVETRDGSKTYIKGEAMLEAPGNILVVAADVYTIVSATDNEIALDDQDEFIHTFKKVDQFWVETLGKTPAAREAYENPITPSINNLQGNWNVYRRQSKPGAIATGTMLIKNIKIITVTGDQSATGEVNFYNNDKSDVQPCTITITGTSMLIKTEKNNWNFPVYKADGKELVFGEKDKLLYFAKPLEMNR
ncbi:MAG: hypothetical protein K2X48_10650 [Chitinophagaceae bacterium]|nr:hypothetical protein [Chitinophagaceae bacterium]